MLERVKTLGTVGMEGKRIVCENDMNFGRPGAEQTECLHLPEILMLKP